MRATSYNFIFNRVAILRGLACLLVGIALSKFLPGDHTIATLVALGVSIGVSLISLIYRAEALRIAAGVTICVAWIAFGISYTNLRRPELLPESGNCLLSGYVQEVTKVDAAQTKIQFKADTIVVGSSRYLDKKGVVTLKTGEHALKAGERLKINGRLTIPVNDKNQYDYVNHLINSHLEFNAVAYDFQTDSVSRRTFGTILASIRAKMIAQLSDNGITPNNLTLLQALFLGDKSRLSPELKRSFSDCGISHILAVSGLHVGIIFQLLTTVFTALRLRRRLSCVLILSALWSYAFLAGMAPSITRATFMMSAVAIAKALGRRTNIYNTLALTLFIILLIDPLSAYSIGLWLSFTAVTGLVAFVGGVEKHFEVENQTLKKLYSLILASFFAQICTLPITLYAFHQFPNYFLINNLIILPIIGVLIPMAVATLALGAIPLLGYAISWTTDKLISFVIFYAQNAAELPGAITADVPFDGIDCALLYVVIVTVAAMINFPLKRTLRILIISVLAFCIYDISAEIYFRTCNAVEIFDGGGKVNVGIRQNGNVTFLLSDTCNTTSLRKTANISREWRCRRPEIQQLRSGIGLRQGSIALATSVDFATVDDAIILLIDNELPADQMLARTFILSANHQWRNVWLDYFAAHPEVDFVDIKTKKSVVISHWTIIFAEVKKHY